MASHDLDDFIFKLNLIIIELECNVDQVMVPLNQGFPQCDHIYLYGEVLIRSVVMPLAGASNEGMLWACCTLVR